MTPPAPAHTYERYTRHGLTIERPAGRPDRKFRARIRFRGTVHALTLSETADESFAQAIRARREIHAGRWASYKAATALRGFTSLETVLVRYETQIRSVADRLEPATIANNMASFRNFIAWALGTETERASPDLKALSVQTLKPSLVNAFKTHYLAVAGDDRALREQRRRGAASILRQVRSIFCLRARLLYQDLALPDLDDFLAQCTIETEPRIHLTIENDTLAAMHAEMELRRQARDPLWIIHALHKYAGLRTDEIVNARVEWFSRAPWGQCFLSVLTRPYFEPKQSQGHVPLSAEVAAQFAPYVHGTSPSDPLVTATSDFARRVLVERTHAAWMRRYLPADRYAKAGYELRRWSAQTMRSKYGDAAAQAFLRHATQTVAGRHYYEYFYPWHNHGTDVGITIADAAGQTGQKVCQLWTSGADALSGLGCATGRDSLQDASLLTKPATIDPLQKDA